MDSGHTPEVLVVAVRITLTDKQHASLIASSYCGGGRLPRRHPVSSMYQVTSLECARTILGQFYFSTIEVEGTRRK